MVTINKVIDYQTMLSYKDCSIQPINLNIGNINIPLSFQNVEKKSIITGIRALLNMLSDENISQVQEKIRDIIISKIPTVENLNEIAIELVDQFISSKDYIKKYITILNYIYNIKVLKEDGIQKQSESIGNCFLRKCRELILANLDMGKINQLALYDLSDMDQLDEYNKEREKAINLIILLCSLYEQKNTSLIRLSALQIMPLLKQIVDCCHHLNNEMLALGDPYAGECLDETKYFLLEKSLTLYVEYLYTFVSTSFISFSKDDTVINNTKMTYYINILRNEFAPKLTEPYLIAACSKLFE